MYSENNDFDSILNRLLANVPDTLDKREGSIIYDALAPAAMELAQCYINLDIYDTQSYILTATGENLDNRIYDYGMKRIEATPAKVIIRITNTAGQLMEVDLGNRFSVPNDYGGYNFSLTEEQSTGLYIAQCETNGDNGNKYIGIVLPLQSINNLGAAEILSIYEYGEDEETDDTLRARALRKINQTAFAGNKAAYREMAIGIRGVEDCRVFPIWNGGGTVKLAIIATNHTLPTQEFVDNVQEEIDPIPNQGEGVGLAPIGHTVTVVAPTQLDININARLTLASTSTISQLEDAITEQIENYIYSVQNDFVEKDTLIIYLSKMSAAILNVEEVLNVASLTINGEAADLVINIDGVNVQYPVLGTVMLSEN